MPFIDVPKPTGEPQTCRQRLIDGAKPRSPLHICRECPAGGTKRSGARIGTACSPFRIINEMPTPVLATKLFVPARRSRLVARPRLFQQLNAALVPGCKLTLVSAPAGFGKSTLVSDWIAHCAQHQPSTRAAWLSLDEGDNDPSRLLTHLVVALHGIDADIGSDALHLLHNAPTLQVEPTLTALINDVTRASEQTLLVLVLDDYHVIEARSAHEAVTFLVEPSVTAPPRRG